ncbi:hypothetical protein AbHV_ORF7 [Abalone herpesvirus Victoria/AUS/2009]|uniref:Uncharacterized protein n=2 Tax=Aurivirus haliotidmalaco1 TaxID=3050290 RepID=K4K8E8_ABHV|nr:hypothetical protein AbHV_ORF7 [Abalone herpesvirus Victoria/AUS/2009]ADP36926.1 p102 [Abalone herpesvirus Victoria/AUS/2007]AFU90017.1 hypothetical protein AbHV_ORF7 [Abalone herpesvirus Victoria/AUS/2009]
MSNQFDPRLKAGQTFSVVSAVNLMLTEWHSIKQIIDLIASSHLTKSLFSSMSQLQNCLEELLNVKSKLAEDYAGFIVPFTNQDNTVISVCLRYSYKVCLTSVDRLISALQLVDGLNERSSVNFTRDMLVIKRSGLLASDIPHRIYTDLCMEKHLARLSPTNDRPSAKVLNHVNPMSEFYEVPSLEVVYGSNPTLTKLIDDCVLLASYPIISPNVGGELITTHGFDTYVPLKLNESGPDSRSQVETPFDSRVCVICKLDNLAIGYTDVIEQHKRLICKCVFIREAPSTLYMDVATHTQATMRVRERLIRDRESMTETEKRLFYNSFDKYASAIASTKIHNK